MLWRRVVIGIVPVKTEPHTSHDSQMLQIITNDHKFNHLTVKRYHFLSTTVFLAKKKTYRYLNVAAILPDSPVSKRVRSHEAATCAPHTIVEEAVITIA